MIVNPVKCHILLSTKNPIDVHLEGSCITFKSCEKLLIRITIDSHLNSDKHISDLWDKVSKSNCIMPSYRFYVFRKKYDCNENVCQITIQLLPFTMDVTFQNFE